MSKDGKNFEKIYAGIFNYTGDNSVKRETDGASWGDIKMKAMKIEITDSVAGYGTAAEINFYTGGSGKPNASGTYTETKKENNAQTESSSSEGKSVSGTEISYSPSWQISVTSDMGSTIGRAFDGEESTFWHSNFTVTDGQVTGKDECPHTITIIFPSEMTISGWLYTPRNDHQNGTIQKYNIYASNDGVKYEKIYTGTFNYVSGDSVREPKGASWGDKKMKAMKIEITESIGSYGSAAEIKFYTGGTGTTNASGALTDDKADQTEAVKYISKEGWTAEVNSQFESLKVEKIIDNDLNTYWHSNYKAEGPTVVSHDNPPYYLTVTLPQAVLTSGIVLTPRSDNANGRIMGANIYVSDSDNGQFFLLKENMEFQNNALPKEIAFTANLKIKRVQIEITASMQGYGTLAEFDLMEAKNGFETVSFKDYAENEAKNQLYEINRDALTVRYDGENWANNNPVNVLDGSDQTFWQSEKLENSDWPAILTVDFKKICGVKEIRYLPRQSDDHHGCWLKVTISGSTDGENWEILKDNIEMQNILLMQTIKLDDEPKVRYLEFQIDKAQGQRAGCAELSFWQTKDAKDALETDNQEKYVLKIGSNVIESTKAGVTNKTEIDVSPYIVNGSTMIPLRGLLEEMGAKVTWNGHGEKITVQSGANTIRLQIWNQLVYVDGTQYGDLRYTLLNPPIIKDSRTFIPIRFVSEQLGYKVSWDAETQTVTIEK